MVDRTRAALSKGEVYRKNGQIKMVKKGTGQRTDDVLVNTSPDFAVLGNNVDPQTGMKFKELGQMLYKKFGNKKYQPGDQLSMQAQDLNNQALNSQMEELLQRQEVVNAMTGRGGEKTKAAGATTFKEAWGGYVPRYDDGGDNDNGDALKYGLIGGAGLLGAGALAGGIAYGGGMRYSPGGAVPYEYAARDPFVSKGLYAKQGSLFAPSIEKQMNRNYSTKGDLRRLVAAGPPPAPVDYSGSQRYGTLSTTGQSVVGPNLYNQATDQSRYVLYNPDIHNTDNPHFVPKPEGGGYQVNQKRGYRLAQGGYVPRYDDGSNNDDLTAGLIGGGAALGLGAAIGGPMLYQHFRADNPANIQAQLAAARPQGQPTGLNPRHQAAELAQQAARVNANHPLNTNQAQVEESLNDPRHGTREYHGFDHPDQNSMPTNPINNDRGGRILGGPNGQNRFIPPRNVQPNWNLAPTGRPAGLTNAAYHGLEGTPAWGSEEQLNQQRLNREHAEAVQQERAERQRRDLPDSEYINRQLGMQMSNGGQDRQTGHYGYPVYPARPSTYAYGGRVPRYEMGTILGLGALGASAMAGGYGLFNDVMAKRAAAETQKEAIKQSLVDAQDQGDGNDPSLVGAKTGTINEKIDSQKLFPTRPGNPEATPEEIHNNLRAANSNIRISDPIATYDQFGRPIAGPGALPNPNAGPMPKASHFAGSYFPSEVNQELFHESGYMGPGRGRQAAQAYGGKVRRYGDGGNDDLKAGLIGAGAIVGTAGAIGGPMLYDHYKNLPANNPTEIVRDPNAIRHDTQYGWQALGHRAMGGGMDVNYFPASEPNIPDRAKSYDDPIRHNIDPQANTDFGPLQYNQQDVEASLNRDYSTREQVRMEGNTTPLNFRQVNGRTTFGVVGPTRPMSNRELAEQDRNQQLGHRRDNFGKLHTNNHQPVYEVTRAEGGRVPRYDDGGKDKLALGLGLGLGIPAAGALGYGAYRAFSPSTPQQILAQHSVGSPQLISTKHNPIPRAPIVAQPLQAPPGFDQQMQEQQQRNDAMRNQAASARTTLQNSNPISASTPEEIEDFNKYAGRDERGFRIPRVKRPEPDYSLYDDAELELEDGTFVSADGGRIPRYEDGVEEPSGFMKGVNWVKDWALPVGGGLATIAAPLAGGLALNKAGVSYANQDEVAKAIAHYTDHPGLIGVKNPGELSGLGGFYIRRDSLLGRLNDRWGINGGRGSRLSRLMAGRADSLRHSTSQEVQHLIDVSHENAENLVDQTSLQAAQQQGQLLRQNPATPLIPQISDVPMIAEHSDSGIGPDDNMWDGPAKINAERELTPDERNYLAGGRQFKGGTPQALPPAPPTTNVPQGWREDRVRYTPRSVAGSHSNRRREQEVLRPEAQQNARRDARNRREAANAYGGYVRRYDEGGKDKFIGALPYIGAGLAGGGLLLAGGSAAGGMRFGGGELQGLPDTLPEGTPTSVTKGLYAKTGSLFAPKAEKMYKRLREGKPTKGDLRRLAVDGYDPNSDPGPFANPNFAQNPNIPADVQSDELPGPLEPYVAPTQQVQQAPTVTPLVRPVRPPGLPVLIAPPTAPHVIETNPDGSVVHPGPPPTRPSGLPPLNRPAPPNVAQIVSNRPAPPSGLQPFVGNVPRIIPRSTPIQNPIPRPGPPPTLHTPLSQIDPEIMRQAREMSRIPISQADLDRLLSTSQNPDQLRSIYRVDNSLADGGRVNRYANGGRVPAYGLGFIGDAYQGWQEGAADQEYGQAMADGLMDEDTTEDYSNVNPHHIQAQRAMMEQAAGLQRANLQKVQGIQLAQKNGNDQLALQYMMKNNPNINPYRQDALRARSAMLRNAEMMQGGGGVAARMAANASYGDNLMKARDQVAAQQMQKDAAIAQMLQSQGQASVAERARVSQANAAERQRVEASNAVEKSRVGAANATERARVSASNVGAKRHEGDQKMAADQFNAGDDVRTDSLKQQIKDAAKEAKQRNKERKYTGKRTARYGKGKKWGSLIRGAGGAIDLIGGGIDGYLDHSALEATKSKARAAGSTSPDDDEETYLRYLLSKYRK